MVVHRRIAKLRLTPLEAERYFPPLGISIHYLEWSPQKEQVIAEFATSDLNPNPLLRKNGKDIRNELAATFRNRLLSDDLGSHDLSPKTALTLNTILNNKNNPYLTTSRKKEPRELEDAVENATNVREEEVVVVPMRQNITTTTTTTTTTCRTGTIDSG